MKAALEKSHRFGWGMATLAVVGGLHVVGVSSNIQSACLISCALFCWITATLPGWWAGLMFITTGMLLALAPPTVMLSGMASSATWMVLSGSVLGAAIEYTGLGKRLAVIMSPWLCRSFYHAVWGSMLLGVCVMLIMPSAMSRILLLLPLLAALADTLGYTERHRGRTAVLLGGVLGTYLPASAVLPANIPNNVLAGAIEALSRHGPQYGSYLLLHFPLLGLAKLVLLGGILSILYHDDAPINTKALPEQLCAYVPMTVPQWRLAIVLSVTVIAWCTEGLHGCSSAWVGMLAAVACLCPASSVLPTKPLSHIDFSPVFYVAGIVSMGALASYSGIAQAVAAQVLVVMPLAHHAPTTNFITLSFLSSLMGVLVTLPGVPAVLTPMTPMLSQATGWSDMAVYMTQVVGFSTVWLPYQAPPLVMAVQSGHVRLNDMVRICLITAALSLLVLWPLDILWWCWLGWI